MITKIDWISFTVDVGLSENRQHRHMYHAIETALMTLAADLLAVLGIDGEAEIGQGRKPYAASLRWPERFTTIFYHPNLTHALIEVSGQGCEQLQEKALLRKVMSAALPRLTRLDIASDILTTTQPLEFAPERHGQRFKTHSEFVSSSGTTCYVGSRSSERYARVYRYNPPHQRSHLLRIEHVLKTETARAAAKVFVKDGLHVLQAQVGNVFGWRHPDWKPDAHTGIALAGWTPERHEGKTEFWLEAQVKPALVKHFAGRTDDLIDWATGIVAEMLAKTR
jgi:hypothetical protein